MELPVAAGGDHFENRAATFGAVRGGGAVQIAGMIERKRSNRLAAILAAGEGMQDPIRPAGLRRAQFEHRTSIDGTRRRRAIEIAGIIRDQLGIGRTAICLPLETVEDGFSPSGIGRR